MDITLNRDTLADKLSEIIGIATRKTTIPALAGVLVDAKKNEATFSATDMEISARVAGQAQVAQAGSVLLPAKRLADIVKLLPADQSVRIASIDANAVRIECGRYNSKMQTFTIDDFPPFPAQPKDVASMKLPSETLTALIRKVQHAVETATDVRYFLSGACMVLAGNRITLVSTDGRRLAIASAARPAGPEAKVLITRQMLGELTAMFEHVDDALTFSVEGNHVRFAVGSRLLISTMIDGQFPAYERIIPKDNDKSVVVERDDLSQALRRVSLATTDATRSVLFNVEKGGVRLTAASADVGEAVEHVDGTVKGGAVAVRLSSQHVLDFLSAAEAGKIVIELKDATGAAILRQLDERDTNYRCIVMPIMQAAS